jgi:ribosomal protein S18 acetylase RimI-like enzyme
MNEISYRRLRKDEVSTAVDLRIIFLRELQGIQTQEIEDELRIELTDYFKKSLADDSFIGWIAESDSKPVGLGGIVIQKIPGTFKTINGHIGYILNMFTISEFRNRGVCSTILDKIISDGNSLGLCKLYLHASNDGIRLYRKRGFYEGDMPELELRLK